MGAKIIDWVASAILWALALYVAAFSSYATSLTHAVPFSDQWDLTDPARLLANGEVTAFLKAAWQPHLEHRLVLFNLINAIDYTEFDYRNRFNTAVLLASMAATALLAVALMRKAGVDRGVLWRWVAPVAIAFVFNGVQTENLTWALGLQWHLADLFVIGAVYAATPIDGDRTEQRVAGPLIRCLACSTLATLSSASGLLVWPVVLIYMLWVSRPRVVWVSYAMAGAAVGALYLLPSTAGGGQWAVVSSALASPGALLAYLARFIGSLWYWTDVAGRGEPVAIAAGYLVLVGAIVTAAAVMLRRLPLTPAGKAAAAVALFGIGTGFLTALGRVTVFSPDQAFAPRYATTTGLTWAALLTLAIVVSSRARVRWAGCALGLLALVALAHHEPQSLRTIRTWAQEREQAALALLAEVPDEELLSRVYPRPAEVIDKARALRSERKSIFAEPRAAYVGAALPPALAAPTLPACQGAAERVELVSRIDDRRPVGLRVHGHVVLPPNGDASSLAVLVLADNRDVVGIGSARAAASGVAGSGTAWFAVVRPTAAALRALVVTGDGPAATVCRLGG
jgi:hypothetical protein